MDSSFFQEIRFLVSDLFLTFERLFCYEMYNLDLLSSEISLEEIIKYC